MGNNVGRTYGTGTHSKNGVHTKLMLITKTDFNHKGTVNTEDQIILIITIMTICVPSTRHRIANWRTGELANWRSKMTKLTNSPNRTFALPINIKP